MLEPVNLTCQATEQLLAERRPWPGAGPNRWRDIQKVLETARATSRLAEEPSAD